MILGFSSHQSFTRSEVPHSELTGYLDGPEYRLEDKSQPPTWAARVPRPEILAGNASVLRLAITASGYKNKYRSGVLSFHVGDVDVGNFNAGRRAERSKVAAIVDLLLRCLTPGIPPRSRPPIYLTTHTHVGRLEINFAIATVVRKPDGPIRYFNCGAPRQTEKLWTAFRDLINLRFGFADPDDPKRRKLVELKTWNADGPQVETITRVVADIENRVRDGSIRNRSGVLKVLKAAGSEHGWSRIWQTSQAISIQLRDGKPGSRVQLTGLACRSDFTSPDKVPKSDNMSRLSSLRRMLLAHAPQDLQFAWAQVAGSNRSRLGFSQLPWVSLDAAGWLAGKCDPATDLIPAAHHLEILNQGQPKVDQNNARPTYSDGEHLDRRSSAARGTADDTDGGDEGITDRADGNACQSGAGGSHDGNEHQRPRERIALSFGTEWIHGRLGPAARANGAGTERPDIAAEPAQPVDSEPQDIHGATPIVWTAASGSRMEFLRRIRDAVSRATPEMLVQIQPTWDAEGRYAVNLSFEDGVQVRCMWAGAHDLSSATSGKAAADRVLALNVALGISVDNRQRQKDDAVAPRSSQQAIVEGRAEPPGFMSVIVFAEDALLLDLFLKSTFGKKPSDGDWPVTRLHPNALETAPFRWEVSQYLRGGGRLECIFVQGTEQTPEHARYLSLLRQLPEGASAASATSGPAGDFDIERLTPTHFQAEPIPDTQTGIDAP